MSCRQHGYPWPSLATSPYRSSPLAGLQGYIPYPHRATVCIFELVVLLLFGHMWGSIGVHHLWAHHIYPTPPLGQDMTQGQFFKRSLTGLNSEAEEPNLSYYLPITGGRIIGFIPFPRVLVLCEMQSVQDLNSCRRVQFLRR